MKPRIPLSVRYISSVYLLGLVVFTVFRLILLYDNMDAVAAIPNKVWIMAQSLFMGVRFDTVISGYILALPAVLLIIADIAGLLSRRVLLAIHVLVCVLYTIAFFGCSADIPFFQNFNTRLNLTILNWADSPLFMLKMVGEEWSYVIYFLWFLVIDIAFIFVLKRVYKRFKVRVETQQGRSVTVVRLLVSLVFIGLMVLGIRGRTDEKSPILIGTAYFSSYDIANQAGLNPVYTFMQSWFDSMREEDKKLKLMDDKDALKLATGYLGISQQNSEGYPLYRRVEPKESAQKQNVVVVIMESMSAYYMQRYGNTMNLTPNLDTLATHGYSFDHFYSAGIHTFNGIYSTLYSFPGLMAKHTMAMAVIPHLTGLPYAMKQNGYKTIYFTTHDDQFDNVGGFLTANNVDSIISKRDYPSKEVLNTLGVPDHSMFDFALPIFNNYNAQGKPFCAMIMTTSNHGPYTIPPGIPFTPKHKEIRGGCVEYADWAIGHFMQEAKKQPWFSNTIFVFVADHGAKEGVKYGDMVYAFNHVPCIIYSPTLHDAPKVINNPGGQIDIFPTIAGLLHLSYVNNTMGTDLLHSQRPWMFFSQDDKIGVADSTQLYTWHTDNREGMYDLNSGADILLQNKSRADSMKHYAFSMIQSTQWLLENRKTGVH